MRSLFSLKRKYSIQAAIKRFVGLLVFLSVSLIAFSQKEIIATTTGYITQNKFERANFYLDSILAKNPKSVDALMMKGNVLLNYSWQHSSKTYFNIERAESIFDTTSINESFFIPIIPEDTSELIEKIWQQCLAIDSTRMDIKKGLCNLYSISLRIDDLKRQLLQMKREITQDSENAYVFSEYARNIKARGHFDDALKIYQLIADMFPNMAGPRCDMAGEYFYDGQPNDALRYLDSAMTKNDIDETSYLNAAGIYSMLGYYDNAYEIFRRYSQRDNLFSADFYKALMMFAKMDSGYFKQLQNFLQKASEQNYYDEVRLAKRLLPYASVTFSLDDYKTLIADASIPDYYKVLIYQRGLLQFKNECEPFLQYGLYQCSLNNFSIATSFLEQINECNSNNSASEYWMMVYAYALYMSREKEKTFLYFKPLEESKDVFQQQAAEYFLARILKEEDKDLTTFKKLINQLIETKNKTKYAWLAENYLNQTH